MTSWLAPLALIYLQTAAMAALFAQVGRWAFRPDSLAEGAGAPHPALDWSRGYFIGVSAALALFVPLARLLGTARRGFVVTLVLLVGVFVFLRISPRWRSESGPSWRATAGVLLAAVLLTLGFSVTNVACWTRWNPSGPSPAPGAWTHFGSIHAGRYANYARLISTGNRVPFLAQNMGQSILAAFHLMLGNRAPLAALMVWVPFTLAALTLLFYGLLRSWGVSALWSSIGAFFVLFCNVGLDWRALFVFDNGCPLGLIGYTDLLLGIGTFLVFIAWIERFGGSGFPSRALPGLLGLIWCWCAPQNIVLALPVLVAGWWVRRRASGGPPVRTAGAVGWAAAVLCAGVLAGAMQLGSLLPRGLQEHPPVLLITLPSHLTVRPYVLYITSHWSEEPTHWNFRVIPGTSTVEPPGVYESLWRDSAARGQGSIAPTLTFAAGQVIRSLLVYFFPCAGLLLLWLMARRERFLFALLVFGAGYAIAFLFEYGELKWWLTRFLVPGTVLCLLWGFEACSDALHRRAAWLRWCVAAGVLIAATAGPLTELGWVCRENLVGMQHIDPIARRLHMMVALDQFFPE